MAREVILRTWCDLCLDNDVNEEGVELAPLLLPEVGGNKPRVLALCEVHLKELYQPLVDALVEHGQMVDDDGNPTGPRGRYKKAASKGGDGEDWACPACDHVSPNRAALNSHARGRHGKSLAALQGAEEKFECPECGMRSARPQGLAAHRRSVHGIIGTSATAVAVREAKSSGGEEGLFTDDDAPELAGDIPPSSPDYPATPTRRKAPAKGRRKAST